MSCEHLDQLRSLRPPSGQLVHREQCTLCFDGQVLGLRIRCHSAETERTRFFSLCVLSGIHRLVLTSVSNASTEDVSAQIDNTPHSMSKKNQPSILGANVIN